MPCLRLLGCASTRVGSTPKATPCPSPLRMTYSLSALCDQPPQVAIRPQEGLHRPYRPNGNANKPPSHRVHTRGHNSSRSPTAKAGRAYHVRGANISRHAEHDISRDRRSHITPPQAAYCLPCPHRIFKINYLSLPLFRLRTNNDSNARPSKGMSG